ncbi:MAG TPA: hypothetical protein PKW95_24460 [bacterium]|nr:hypothetical protein [bacterium]
MSAAHNIALRVATDLRHVQVENLGDQPLDVIHDNTVYRLLDAPYYAWLRRRMERAKQAFDAGKMPQVTWQTLRQRFNGIHGWAVSHIGEPALVQAIKTLDEKSYLAPRHDHAIDLVESWDERAAIMEHDGGLAHDDAEQSAARLVSRELTPEDVESFKALDVEVHVKSKPGEFTLVPEYTGKERPEISAEDLRKLSMIMHAFPGSEITYVGPQQEPWSEPYVPQAPAPKSATPPSPKPQSTEHKHAQPPEQARLF